MKFFCLCLLFGVFIASTFADDQEIAAIVKSYDTKLEKLTPKPALVNSWIYTLCVAPSKEKLERLKNEIDGPHFLTYVEIYSDKEGAAALDNNSATLPVGTVIVKKKSSAVKYEARDGTISGKEGLGGMIKRKPGYDPENGDWEYFYADKAGRLSSGKLKNCIECHQRAKETDFVFRTWKNLINTAKQ